MTLVTILILIAMFIAIITSFQAAAVKNWQQPHLATQLLFLPGAIALGFVVKILLPVPTGVSGIRPMSTLESQTMFGSFSFTEWTLFLLMAGSIMFVVGIVLGHYLGTIYAWIFSKPVATTDT